MEAELVIFKCIMLLYWEALLPNNGDNSARLVKEILTELKPDGGFCAEEKTEAMNYMRATALWMADQPQTTPYDKASLLSRIRMNTKNSIDLMNIYLDTFEVEYSTDDLLRNVLAYRSELYAQQQRSRIVDTIDRYSRNLKFNPDSINWHTIAGDIQNALEPLKAVATAERDPAIVDEVHTSKLTTMADAVRRGLEEIGVDGILRTRWQGVNRMLGEHGGFRRGDMAVVGALAHNFKTGFTLEITRQIAMYNKPFMRDETKKPLIVHISTENSVKDNILQLYCTLKAQETGKGIKLTDLANYVKDHPDEYEKISQFVIENLERTGYEVRFLRVDPSIFTYQSLTTLLARYMAEGYEIHLLTIDYLNMMNKAGMVQGPAGFEVRDLFRRLRNYCHPLGITVITPHQISSAGKAIRRSGVSDFVKHICKGGFYDSCSNIDQEVDIEIFIHIEIKNGISYLTIHRGKHRKSGEVTPEKDLFTVYQFDPILGIPEDVDGEDMSRRSVGGNTMSSGGGTAWDDFG